MNNREAFEAWANTHGGLDLTVHEAMDNEKLSFPCTYYSYTTEIAWRAFANKKVPAQAALASQAQQTESKPALKVVNGEICYKSTDDDQSYGMWCPVSYDTKHSYKEGTKFFVIPPEPEGDKP